MNFAEPLAGFVFGLFVDTCIVESVVDLALIAQELLSPDVSGEDTLNGGGVIAVCFLVDIKNGDVFPETMSVCQLSSGLFL